MLIINKSLNLSLFIVFYFSTKYLIMLGKVADQGPHTNCTSHSLTFPPPIDLQPSFWASVNNRESPSLDNPHILFANITERYSRNTNIFQLCKLIFHKIYQEGNNNNNMSSSSTPCVANKRQSLIDKGFAKSRRQMYELIGLLYEICWIASLWYLFNSVFITNFSHTRSKSLTDRANLNKRLRLRFAKIFKRPVIGERKCRVCLAEVRGGEMNAWRTNPKGRLRGG